MRTIKTTQLKDESKSITFHITIQKCGTGEGYIYKPYLREIQVQEMTATHLIDSNGISWNRKSGIGKFGSKKTTWFIPKWELETINENQE